MHILSFYHFDPNNTQVVNPTPAVFETLTPMAPFLIKVITGSRMATVWANIAVAPVNGFCLMTHTVVFRLPATVDAALLDDVWDKLQKKRAADAAPGVQRQLLPPLLRTFAPPNHASLAYFCEEWVLAGCPEEVATFCQQLFERKIYPEVGVPRSESACTSFEPRLFSHFRCDLLPEKYERRFYPSKRRLASDHSFYIVCSAVLTLHACLCCFWPVSAGD